MRKSISAILLTSFLTALLLRPVSANAQAALVTQTTDATPCELTKANGRLPESPVPGRASSYFGNDSVAIGLGPNGLTVIFQPGGAGFVLPDGSLQWKFLWAKVLLPMTIEGRRLDAAAPPLRSDVPHEFDDDNFQPSYLIFPTPGCWEVTSRVGQSALTFVIKVVKIGEGPTELSQRQRREAIAAPDRRDPVDRLDLPVKPERENAPR